MSAVLLAALLSITHVAPPAEPGGAGAVMAAPVVTFGSLFGPSGALRTPSASTVGHLHGKLSIWENFGDESLDQVTVGLGLSELLEVGLRSDIPSRAAPQLGLWFKLNGIAQDLLFPGHPGLAFGIHRESTFIVAGYQTHFLSGNAGVSFSDLHRGPFANVSVSPHPSFAVQLEYDHSVRSLGASVRGAFRFAQLSFGYLLPVDEAPAWDAARAFLGLHYQY